MITVDWDVTKSYLLHKASPSSLGKVVVLSNAQKPNQNESKMKKRRHMYPRYNFKKKKQLKVN